MSSLRSDGLLFQARVRRYPRYLRSFWESGEQLVGEYSVAPPRSRTLKGRTSSKSRNSTLAPPVNEIPYQRPRFVSHSKSVTDSRCMDIVVHHRKPHQVDRPDSYSATINTGESQFDPTFSGFPAREHDVPSIEARCNAIRCNRLWSRPNRRLARLSALEVVVVPSPRRTSAVVASI